MKTIKLIALIMISLTGGIYFTSCQSNSSPQSGGGKVTVNEFEQKLNETKNAQLIDVRTAGEYAEGHLKDASNIDYRGNDFEEKIQKLDKSKPTFIYCLSGGRSGNASEKMKELGFKEVYDLKGGIMAWNNAEKPLAATNGNVQKGMTLNDFNNHTKSNKLVLADFNAKWCAPCQKMNPFLEEISKDQKDKLELMKIDVDENSSLTKELKIEGPPVFLLFKNGNQVWKHEGFIEKEDLMKVIQTY